jgi:methyl-accepting chemotaxis protein
VSEELTAAASREFKFSDIDFRDLAQRSATAAKEIKQLIDNSVEKVNAGTFLARDAGATMKDIIDSVSHVTGIMSDISSASAEQSSGITQVNDAVMQMDGVTQQNAALVEEAAAATGSLEQQGEKLMQALAVFKLTANAAAAASTAAAAVPSKASRSKKPQRAA